MRRFLTLTLLLLAVRLDAGQDVWTPIGPEGGTVTALAFSLNGRTAYVGTADSGLYKSVNGGRSWTPTGDGVRGAAQDLETDPTAPATVYTATSRGVFKSDDAGATWTDLTSRLPELNGATSARGVVAAPAEPGTLYVHLYDPYVINGRPVDRVYRSSNRGASWQLAVTGLPRFVQVEALAAHPRQRGVVFAGTSDGLFRSTDSGRTWVRSGLRGNYIAQVAFDALQPERLYVVRMVPQHHDSYPEVLVSTRDGRNWRAGSGTSGSGPVDLAVDPFIPGTAYLGVSVTNGTAIYKTTDAGAHWQSALPPGEYTSGAQSGVQALAVNPRVPGMLLTSRDDFGGRAILRTLDGGASWSASGSGFRGVQARQVVADPADPDTLYLVGDCCSLWKTEDTGRTWRRIEAGLAPGVYAGLALDPAVPSTLYVSTSSGMFKSLDGGETWSGLANSFSAAELAIDPAHPATLYGAMGQTVRKSPDAGITWEVLPAREARTKTVIEIAPGSSPTVFTNGISFADGGYRDSVDRSTDGGVTWATVFQLGIRDGFIRDLLVHSQDPDRVLAAFAVHGGPLFSALSGGVFRSAGGRWRRSSLSPESPPVLTLAQDPRDPAWVYAGSSGAVFVSRDRGANWTSRSAGLPPGDVQDLEVDPLDPATVYAATNGGLYAMTQTH
ncbi:MAG TPA: hypothetical protein VMW27_20100 [Thermoanaerobaculia bacterium]|nr:hypothetical protein [Thermoanaerobaculia bacterium]